MIDGGSSDGTAERVLQCPDQSVRLLAGPRGRGSQLRHGAALSTGAWLLFIHADTLLGTGWENHVGNFTQDAEKAKQVGYFRLRFDSPTRMARLVERIVAWRCRVWGLPYGDQGLLISRLRYDQVGGFAAVALMEDVDLAMRIPTKDLVAMDCDAVTSAARYEGRWIRQTCRNLCIVLLWRCGVSPQRLAKLYGRGFSGGKKDM